MKLTCFAFYLFIIYLTVMQKAILFALRMTLKYAGGDVAKRLILTV